MDEAGMVAAKDMEKLLERARAEQAHVLLVGDTRQIGSVGAGAAFTQLREQLGSENLTEIVRQRHEGLRQAVYDALAGKTAEALSRVQVFEIKQEKPDRAAPDRSEIDAGSDHALAQSAEIRREELREAAIAAIVNRYQYWTEAEKDVLVIALSRADREALNEALHAEKPGRNDPRPVDTLDSKQWTAAQRSDAARYRPGDQIEWGRDYQDGPRKGEITPVVAQRDGQVTAQRADGT
ncbi:TrwC protein, partial [mine drainage metagenome]